jgi:hypothetical protein
LEKFDGGWNMKILRGAGCGVAALALAMMGGAAWAAAGAAGAAGTKSYTVEFKTVTGRGEYAPRHTLAVWVVDRRGAFVKSLVVRGRKHVRTLRQWNNASKGDATDAVTGASLSSHGRIEAQWDGTDASGKPAPDGDYGIRLEFCEGGASRATPGGHIPFSKGPAPVNRSYPDTPQFKNIAVRSA